MFRLEGALQSSQIENVDLKRQLESLQEKLEQQQSKQLSAKTESVNAPPTNAIRAGLELLKQKESQLRTALYVLVAGSP